MKKQWKSFKASFLSQKAGSSSDLYAIPPPVVDFAIGPSKDHLSQNNEDSNHLPPEIEYEIFALAFHNDEEGRTRLLRVAKRVAEWLVPMLYEVVIIAEGDGWRLYPPIESLQQHGHHVKRIIVSSASVPFTQTTLLSTCPNVTDLVLWYGIDTTAEVLKLPITRLFFKNTDFVGAELWDLPKTPQIERWCSNITHVVLGSQINDSDSIRNLNVLTLFPSLTHFMTFCWNKAPVIHRILGCCPRLKVFVWLWGKCGARDFTKIVKGEDECPVDDPRIVTLNGYYLMDWIRGSRGEDDIWRLAEGEIRRSHRNINSSPPFFDE
ncbi:hypothetical protein BDN72DRAFT_485696 [Pluteus cervinus]|uniref:Uncharacterized protein n=1 Tax=Pluteus cervinus TaxID=181527 RepID=A0ACD3A5Z6_9AGAR|nr:hypothetical protein BDN72DRAFT_485696 [Pluteus cervinus]